MKTDTLIEIIASAHITHSLNGVPKQFCQAGGIMVVAPPGNLKTTLIERALTSYSDALCFSDINVRQLVQLLDEVSAKKYRTLAFPDYEKIYSRDSDTAANIEGHLKGLSEQGMTHASFEDRRMFKRKARALLVCGMVDEIYERKWKQWSSDGFMRRFIWVHYVLKRPESIARAIHHWKPLPLGEGVLPGIPIDPIPFDVSETESGHIKTMLHHHEGGQESPFVLLKKIFAVMKHRYSRRKDGAEYAMSVLADFAESLNKKNGGAELDL